jgi:uncharacterized membrane protein
MTTTVVALYDDMETASKAVRALRDAGVSNDHISLAAQDAGGEYGKYVGTKTTDTTADGAATGAGVGAIVGGIGGLLLGLGARTIPGIGPILAAGPLATAVSALIGAGAGALAGGVAGGLLGALVDMGVPEEHATYYTEGVRRGGSLVTVAADDMEADRVNSILNRFNPVNIKQRAEAWRQAGWKGYDASAKPYTPKQTAQERLQYQNQTYANGVQSYRRITDTTTPSSMGSATRPADMERYASAWRGHYQTQYAQTGMKYEQYEPAYQYGYTLRNDPRYRDYDWTRLEPEARYTWEQQHTGTTWDKIKDAVRYSWENFKQAVRG